MIDAALWFCYECEDFMPVEHIKHVYNAEERTGTCKGSERKIVRGEEVFIGSGAVMGPELLEHSR